MVSVTNAMLLLGPSRATNGCNGSGSDGGEAAEVPSVAGECPGVGITCAGIPSSWSDSGSSGGTRSTAADGTSISGMTARWTAMKTRPHGVTPGGRGGSPRSTQHTSLSCTARGAPVNSRISAAEPMWAQCACVRRIRSTSDGSIPALDRPRRKALPLFGCPASTTITPSPRSTSHVSKPSGMRRISMPAASDVRTRMPQRREEGAPRTGNVRSATPF